MIHLVEMVAEPEEVRLPFGRRPEPNVWREGACCDCHLDDRVDSLSRCVYCADLHELTTRPWTHPGEPPADISGYTTEEIW